MMREVLLIHFEIASKWNKYELKTKYNVNIYILILLLNKILKHQQQFVFIQTYNSLDPALSKQKEIENNKSN